MSFFDGVRELGAIIVAVLDKAHVYLKKYRLVAILIIIFFAYECRHLTEWYMQHYQELKDWQNAPVIGLIGTYVTALKFALDHILKDSGADGGASREP